MAARMNDTGRCYEILELKPDASQEEIKQAYRDLVKVWHPDRFSHDPRLQQKAQEKLKEINEAYEQLQSFRSGRRRRGFRTGPTPPPPPRSSQGNGTSGESPRIWHVPTWLAVLAVPIWFLLFRLIPVVRFTGILLGVFFLLLFLILHRRSNRNPKKP